MTDRSNLRLVLIRGIVDVGVFSSLINILLLVIPLYLLQVYDRVLPSSSIDTLLFLSAIAITALGFLGALDAIRSIYAQRVAAILHMELGSRAFAVSLASSRHAGNASPLDDLESVCAFIRSRGGTALFDLPFAPFFVALLYLIHPALFWLTLAGAALLIGLVAANQLAVGRNDALAAERSAAVRHCEQLFARNAETLRTMGMARNATEAWGRHFSQALSFHARSSTANAIFSGMSRTARMTLQLAILGVGAWLVLRGEMTAGMIFASSLVSSRALQPLDQLIGHWRQITDARRSWKRLASALAASPAPMRKLKLPAPSGSVSVKDLIFIASNAAAGSEPIIKRLNFDIRAGEAVAIVGPSGAGKSTLARLLVGALQPTSGSVKIDGADLRLWDENQLGKQIGYLAQEIELLPGTIAENVARLEPDADEAGIIEAAKRARAHGLILAQHDGYQTRLGLPGCALSGGERQKIALARAFYGNPRLLVLDEPNAHLDGRDEAALEDMLASARKTGATVVVVTHRPSTAAACDRVMVLRDGLIKAFGPSGEVLGHSAAGKDLTHPQRQNSVTTEPVGLAIHSISHSISLDRSR
ncbi:ATP-binding cassette subfamily C protein [Pseudaminobacter salicylatoxidans]|uniref:ATP-binding cassette subfamily C protein n=1 Tax=Pseudaminobacter salicylatoxidans TaxID=93369 RepID=A0A316C1D3_PSESE|nr:type I secretion system permease/ATPase [Pseudaminobacter salicylatoxidans]PWJ82263.1 ATP-binding cassette subfamily C protein [Pseudaminobacter salicylatoxidans]